MNTSKNYSYKCSIIDMLIKINHISLESYSVLIRKHFNSVIFLSDILPELDINICYEIILL